MGPERKELEASEQLHLTLISIFLSPLKYLVIFCDELRLAQMKNIG